MFWHLNRQQSGGKLAPNITHCFSFDIHTNLSTNSVLKYVISGVFWGQCIMSNGSFVPLSIAPPPPQAPPLPGSRPDSSGSAADKFLSPQMTSMNVVASKSAPGHVVAAPTSSGAYGDREVTARYNKEKYKWHTVVDGFSKYRIFSFVTGQF